MALRWYWHNLQGKIRVTDREDKAKKFIVNLYAANCLLCGIHLYKDEQTKKTMYDLQLLANDAENLRNTLKRHDGRLFDYYDVTSIELNTFFNDSVTIAKILVKFGYKVTLYYKEIKEPKNLKRFE